MANLTLSIVVPAYNEERFIGTLLERIRQVDLDSIGVAAEIVVVDDCSSDRTGAIAASTPGVTLHRMVRNSGKGAAVRQGLALAAGDYVIIQDADLEYDPQDYLPMMRAILDRRADVVYGSRYMGRGRYPAQSLAAYLGGRSLSLVALASTGWYLTDTVTALKLFPKGLLESLQLQTSGFELDHEITAKVLVRGLRILEVPVQYFPRSREEGKKIGMRDWFVAVRTYLRFRKG